MMASCKDRAKRSLISSVMGAPVHIDTPRSRCRRPHTQSANCFQTGWSRPSFARSAAMTPVVAACPSPDMSLASTTSPGMTRRSRKITAATPRSVGNIRRNRRTMYLPMTASTRTPSCPRRRTGGPRRRMGELLGEPHRVELVVQIVARSDLPAVDLARIRNDPMPLQRHDVVHLLVEEMLLEEPHVPLPLVGVEGATLLLIEVVEHLVVVEAVVRRVAVARGELVEVQVGLHDVAALEVHRHLEVRFPEHRVVGGGFDDVLLGADPDLAPLIDQPHYHRLVGHGHAPVLEREREILRARFLEEPLRLRSRRVDVAAVAGQLG